MIKMPSETWSLSPKRTFTSPEPGEDLYDRLPYVRNFDICNGTHVKMESGNIIKFYESKENKKNFSIPNRDDEFENIIAASQKKRAQQLEAKKSADLLPDDVFDDVPTEIPEE